MLHLNTLWFLTYIFVIAKIAGSLDWPWWLVLLPAAISTLLDIALLFLSIEIIDEDDSQP